MRVLSKLFLLPSVIGVLAFTGCHRGPDNRVQGYTEGEYLYMASQIGGSLEKLAVERGQRIKQGDLLFELDRTSELASRDAAQRRLREAMARLADAQKGERPTELAQLDAQLKKARAALQLSIQNYDRTKKLFDSGTAARSDFDAAKSQREQDQHAVEQALQQLQTARLGARTDQVVAAGEEVKMEQANLRNAQWSVDQKTQTAPKDSLVFDILYRPGEYVAAGQPVVMLLPPEYIKVRAFVPEELVGRLQPGDSVQVHVDGVPTPFSGRIRYISPQVEFAPPVIYSRELRSKFVTMVEIRFSDEDARQLHPGQPVDVDLPPPPR